MSVTTVAQSPLELKKNKPIKKTMVLPGDFLLARKIVLLASLANDKTRIEGIPSSPAMLEFLKSVEQLGVEISEFEGHTMVAGGLKENPVIDPFPIDHELIFSAIAAIGAAKGWRLPLKIADNRICEQHLLELGLLFNIETLLEPNLSSIQEIFLPGSEPEFDERKVSQPILKTAKLFYAATRGVPVEFEMENPGPDHIERLLQLFEAGLVIQKGVKEQEDELTRRIARLKKADQKKTGPIVYNFDAMPLQPVFVSIPGDQTASAICALAATLTPGSELVLENVLLNTSRNGFFTAMRRMGADIEVTARREKFGEAFGTVKIRHSKLVGRRFGPENLQNMRDEIPLLFIAAAAAEGETIIRGIEHLRGYRVDLLNQAVISLRAAGLEVGEVEDGLVIRGKSEFDAVHLDCHFNPIFGFAFMIMGLRCHGISHLQGWECLENLYPGLAASLSKQNIEPGQ